MVPCKKLVISCDTAARERDSSHVSSEKGKQSVGTSSLIDFSSHRRSSTGDAFLSAWSQKKRALVCYICAGRRHPARLCPTPPDHATRSVEEEGDTSEEWSEESDVCGVEWECGLNDAGDEDDDILGMGWESTEQSNPERLAVGRLGSRQRFTGRRMQSCETQRNPKSEAGIGFRGADGRANPQPWSLMSVAKMVAAENRVHLDGKDPRTIRPKGDIIPLRKAGKRVP